MFVCLTTVNFPNVMFPAYNANSLNCTFFIVFIFIGQILLQNMILASVYDNFKIQIRQQAETGLTLRIKLVADFFDIFDKEQKGFLTNFQAKKFFKFLLDLDLRKPADKAIFE
jgi:hypothetical protein